MNHATTAPVAGRTTSLFQLAALRVKGARAVLGAALFAAFLAAPAHAQSEQTEKVNLNQAAAETLQYIPGIGPGKAADIVSTRAAKGGFKHMSDLLEVPGIGQKTLADIKKYGTLKGGVSELSEEMRNNPPVKSRHKKSND
ncbi:MAG: helix-hairpin-helix domain-containing protein [Gammaproteobacteria bacterium]|nr:helix-hairpin-helix domain-containing protein [Gammaproteobacteria bacterium]CAJ2376735.1 MAG: exported hypothetical protein [Arenicellales bacterium IbO2]MDA7962834.1 helix-hairpin-helix domain-containing protein [Gammaproteobacteria bacterium]MDA7970172.1 helix-hairpin-helix domain-containing protein [Gammaproteobacteria bacterium]MDA7972255.1 helix-hairpin-helix domain-containing protein [Gammaproteobacteria bacterium]